MEFHFNINDVFHDLITKLDGQSLAKRCTPNVRIALDLLGEASQNAQKLHRPVTSAASFIGSDQTLYMLIDPKRNGGQGAILGLIKTGPKKLFLLNRKGVQHEMNLLCILDFYIHESCQRMGLGKMLFDHFLKVEDFNISQLVIDRPSTKFLAFLNKHYRLHDIIPQVNNFVVFEGFFGHESQNNSPANKNQSVLPNRWNSMIDVNAAGDNNPFRARGNQSSISCLFNQPNKPGNNNDMWRANSYADVRKSPLQPTVFTPEPNQPFPRASNATKFTHHRLW